jgi:hypothetical protein
MYRATIAATAEGVISRVRIITQEVGSSER